MDRLAVEDWCHRLKVAWEGGDQVAAVSLFSDTKRYYERPFHAATSRAEIESYWKDIDELEDIVFRFEVVAVDGSIACIHWQNEYTTRTREISTRHLLDGIFMVTFNSEGRCVEFRQWWFKAPDNAGV